MRIMRKRALAFLAAFGFAALAGAVDLTLVQTLVQQLGVTETQAAGGAGSLLNYAKGALSKDDYGKVTKAVPEANDLIKKAPKTDSKSAAVGSALGSAAGSAAGLVNVGSSFKKLGLSSDMVGKFAPVVCDYAEKKGGATTGEVLRKVLVPEAAPAKQ